MLDSFPAPKNIFARPIFFCRHICAAGAVLQGTFPTEFGRPARISASKRAVSAGYISLHRTASRDAGENPPRSRVGGANSASQHEKATKKMSQHKARAHVTKGGDRRSEISTSAANFLPGERRCQAPADRGMGQASKQSWLSGGSACTK